MNRQQMKDFIALNIEQQGDKGAINLSSLMYAIVDKLFADPQTGVSPIVVSISKEGVRDGSRTIYEIVTPQDELNVYIDEAQTDKAKTRLFVQDGDALIGFPYLEINGTTISGDAVTNDGHYHLQLSNRAGQSYFVHDETTNGIAQVTESEIKAYKTQFNADYSKAENVFKITVGTTVINMSPADMMLIQEEYNKVSNDADYTAMWAYSQAKYICAPKWFEGFTMFKLHSAFYKAADTIIIDLNSEDLSVASLTSAFLGCSRLEQIYGVLDLSMCSQVNDAFAGCGVLHTVKLRGVGVNIGFDDCKQLSKDSVKYLIENCAAANFTLTLNSYVYNELFSSDDWADVKALLQTKTNITVKSVEA